MNCKRRLFAVVSSRLRVGRPQTLSDEPASYVGLSQRWSSGWADVREAGLWDREADELQDYVGIADDTTGVVLVAGPKSNGRLPALGTHVAPRWPYQADKSIRYDAPASAPGDQSWKARRRYPGVCYFFLAEAAR
jgi:hypothetical protein